MNYLDIPTRINEIRKNTKSKINRTEKRLNQKIEIDEATGLILNKEVLTTKDLEDIELLIRLDNELICDYLAEYLYKFFITRFHTKDTDSEYFNGSYVVTFHLLDSDVIRIKILYDGFEVSTCKFNYKNTLKITNKRVFKGVKPVVNYIEKELNHLELENYLF